MSLGGLAASLYGLVFFLRREPDSQTDNPVNDVGRACSLKTAAVFAALVSLILLLSAGLNAWLGARAMLLGAALTGLADAHATAASAASLMAAGKISSAQAVGLILIGLTSGYFVVPMNALLQHRGHVLLSAGHSIAVQNFNEQLNILLMVAIYTVLLWLQLSISIIIGIFGLLVAGVMLLLIRWNQSNLKRDPGLLDQIGQEGHGKAL